MRKFARVSAVNHSPIVRAPVPWRVKSEAFVHLTNNVSYLLMVLLSLLVLGVAAVALRLLRESTKRLGSKSVSRRPLLQRVESLAQAHKIIIVDEPFAAPSR